jgi:integrase/recombinase XerD
LGAIGTSTHTGLRDRALLGTLAYAFARIGAVVNLKVEDYYPSGKRFLLRFKEKGGKEKDLPVHHKLEELLDEYLKATGLGAEPGAPLFPAALGKTGKNIAPAARAHRCRGHAQTTSKTSWIAGTLFAALIPGDWHHEFSGK